MAAEHDLLRELVASNKRIEALLVTLIEASGTVMPRPLARVRNEYVGEAVSMALSDTPAAEVAEHIHGRKQV